MNAKLRKSSMVSSIVKRSVIAANNLIEVVRSSNRQFVEGEVEDDGTAPIANRGTAAVNQNVAEGRQSLPVRF